MRFGDVFEFDLKIGVAIVQVVGQHKRYKSWVVRVLDTDPLSPPDLDTIPSVPEKCAVIIAKLEIPQTDGVARFLGSAPVPAQYENGVPLFRANSSVLDDGQLEPGQWWLDNGSDVWRVGNLAPEHRNIPSRTIWSLAAVRRTMNEELYSGASAGTPQIIGNSSRNEFKLQPRNDGLAKFYLYFFARKDALNARATIKKLKPFLQVTVQKGEEDSKTALIASAALDDDWTGIDELDRFFEQIAVDFRGEYDGNQIPF